MTEKITKIISMIMSVLAPVIVGVILIIVFCIMLKYGAGEDKHPSKPVEVEDVSGIGYPDITVYGAPEKWNGTSGYYYVIDNKEGVVYLQHLNVAGQSSTESMSIMLKRNGEPLTIDDLRGY